MPNDIKQKDIGFNVKSVNEAGEFSGYCNVFDIIDSYGDIVRKGAFLESINEWKAKGKLPPILWQHNRNEVIGVWTELYEDEKGLYGKGKLLINDVARAREAHALMKHNAIDGLSIGYRVNKWSYDEDTDVYDLLAIDLKEISVVTFPANDQSLVDTVKSVLQKGNLPTLPEFEKFLREAGFSKKQATAIAGHGLRSLLVQGEPDTTETAKDDISNAINILSENPFLK